MRRLSIVNALFKCRNFFIISLSLCLPMVTLAWDIPTHKVIAEIAYENLLPTTKQRLYPLLRLFQRVEPNTRTLQQLAAWPDIIKLQDIHAFDSWHYINIPFSTDDSVLPPVATENAVWAVQQAQSVLAGRGKNSFMSAWFLSYLSHIVGDLHQPLHASTRVSKQYPMGDQGGNLYPIKDGRIRSLHQLWDTVINKIPATRMRKKQIISLAKELQNHYPMTAFDADQISNQNPQQWANESFDIAKSFVYKTPANRKPSLRYRQQARTIAERQVVLAGYRLAYILNHLLS